MRFRFRLERVLDFLRLNETVKKMEVATLIQKIEGLEKKKTYRQETMRSMLCESRQHWNESVNWIPYQTAKVEADARDIANIEKEMVRLQIELEDKKYELGKLAMKRKAMENLREKRKFNFRVEQTRREQKTNDELYRLVKKVGN